jgi:Tfp pilus assembly protein PilF
MPEDLTHAKPLVHGQSEIVPIFINTFMHLVRGYLTKQKFADALALLQTFIEHYPENSEAYTLLAEACVGLREYEKAQTYYEIAIEIDPERACR